MRIAFGCDHGGFPLKAAIMELLESLGHEVLDQGAYSLDPQDDYPDFSDKVARLVSAGQVERGVLVCGSGVGACIVANKVHGVRASVCHDTYTAAQGVEHDNMNVLCLGARVVGPALMEQLVRAFAGATFCGQERHLRRLEKLRRIEMNP